MLTYDVSQYRIDLNSVAPATEPSEAQIICHVPPRAQEDRIRNFFFHFVGPKFIKAPEVKDAIGPMMLPIKVVHVFVEKQYFTWHVDLLRNEHPIQIDAKEDYSTITLRSTYEMTGEGSFDIQ